MFTSFVVAAGVPVRVVILRDEGTQRSCGACGRRQSLVIRGFEKLSWAFQRSDLISRAENTDHRHPCDMLPCLQRFVVGAE